MSSSNIHSQRSRASKTDFLDDAEKKSAKPMLFSTASAVAMRFLGPSELAPAETSAPGGS